MKFKRFLVVVSILCSLRLPLASSFVGLNHSGHSSTLNYVPALTSATFVTTSFSKSTIAFSFHDVGRFLIQLDREKTSIWVKALEFLAAGAIGNLLPSFVNPATSWINQLLHRNRQLPLLPQVPVVAPPLVVAAANLPIGKSLVLYGSGFVSGWSAAEGTAFFKHRLISTHCIKNGPQISASFTTLQKQAKIYKQELADTKKSLQILTYNHSTLLNHSNTLNIQLLSTENNLQFAQSLYLNSTEDFNTLKVTFNNCKENVTSLSTDLLQCNHNQSLNDLKIYHLNSQINKIKNYPVTNGDSISVSLRKESSYWSSLAQYILPSECYFGVKAVPLHTNLRESTGVVVCKDIWDIAATTTRDTLIMSLGFLTGYVTRSCLSRPLPYIPTPTPTLTIAPVTAPTILPSTQ